MIVASAVLGTADVAGAVAAAAAPETPDFGPEIEGYAAYDPQTTCSPTAKPGVLAFRDLLLRTYPDTSDFGIVRACEAGGKSEHKEGRAFDWGVSATSQSSTADDLLNWLLATDRHGNQHAMARRLGIMYMIWNRRIWRAYRTTKTWATYTGSNPHTDHIHFSFGRSGAAKQTSFWTGSTKTFVAGASGTDGYVMASSDGSVLAYGQSPYHGSLGEAPPAAAVVDLAVPPSGDGYWLVAEDGTVYSFGATQYRGGANTEPLGEPVSGMAAPNASGYWLATRDGGVLAYGDAPFHGSLPAQGARPNSPIVGIAATPAGRGYWLVAEDGAVSAFGDAQLLGSPEGQPLGSRVVGMAPTPSGAGYWLVAADGEVFPYGDATFHGSKGGASLSSPISGIAPTPSGRGYRLLAEDGGVFPFGDAVFPGSSAPQDI